jgi:hypothetical protein
MTRITQKDPHQFVVESDHELESYFSQIKHFDFVGKRYEINGSLVPIQATDPEYSFAYAISVTPVV